MGINALIIPRHDNSPIATNMLCSCQYLVIFLKFILIQHSHSRPICHKSHPRMLEETTLAGTQSKLLICLASPANNAMLRRLVPVVRLRNVHITFSTSKSPTSSNMLKTNMLNLTLPRKKRKAEPSRPRLERSLR